MSQDTVTIVRLNNIWQPGFDSAISELVLHAITKFSAHKDIGTMLAPINLYGKHWVGLILEKVSEGIFEIYYIDSANRVIDENIKIALAHAFADYDIKVK
ncbi:hypothetical protein [Candidatus Lariskella endosymbiont of Hedychridium roseum]|uniref:hypothetical protein n=1 Tax=Candidatus Lariskella endosymbiont of Hedychridium roseum TaxID=3077949 RepID=UPI0030D2DDD1